MARFGLLLLLAAALGGTVASPVGDEQEVLFPGAPGNKRWDWNDCGERLSIIMSPLGKSYSLIRPPRHRLAPRSHQEHRDHSRPACTGSGPDDHGGRRGGRSC